jgi:hypothetical protein
MVFEPRAYCNNMNRSESSQELSEQYFWGRVRLGDKSAECTDCFKSWISSNLTVGVRLISQEVVEKALGDDQVDI